MTATNRTCRQAYTPEEAALLGGRIEAVAAKLAKEAQRAAGGDKKSEAAKAESPTGNSRNRSRDAKAEEARTTKGQAAAAVGMDRRTYEKVKAVVATGDRSLIDEMNRTGKVSGAQKSAASKPENEPTTKILHYFFVPYLLEA